MGIGLGIGLSLIPSSIIRAQAAPSAQEIIASLNGANFSPKANLSNCWQDTIGTIPGAEDAICSLLESDFRSGSENLIVDSESTTGTESTVPTSWSLTTHGGITTTCVGKGIDSEGHGYSLIRFSGTATVTAYPAVYFINTANDFVTINGMLFSSSIVVKIHAGSLTGFNAINWRSLSGKNSSNINTTDIIMTDIKGSLNSTEQKFSGGGIVADAATVAVNTHILLPVASGNTVDITLQISQPQLNRGRPQAYVPTYGTAVINGTYHCLTQATAGYTPFLRKSLSVLPIISDTGETWSISRTQVSDCAGIRWDESGVPYLKAVGVANNYISTPNAVANQITGDISIVFKVKQTDLTNHLTILDKGNTAGNRAFSFYVRGSDGKSGFMQSVDGTATTTSLSNNSIYTTSNIVLVRIKRTSSTGLVTHEYSNDDGATWIANGSGTLTTGPLFTSTLDAKIGAGFAGILGIGNIYSVALYANNTATGVPAVEFNPTGVVRPTNYWLDADGVDDFYVTTIQPGIYNAGYVCGVWNQYEAIANINIFFGSVAGTNIPGYSLLINTSGKVEASRSDGTAGTSPSTTSTITQYSPFVASGEFEVTRANPELNGIGTENSITRDFRGTSQVALVFSANIVSSGYTPSGSYFNGSCSGMCWIPVIPTDEQQVTLRSYYASLGQITL